MHFEFFSMKLFVPKLSDAWGDPAIWKNSTQISQWAWPMNWNGNYL